MLNIIVFFIIKNIFLIVNATNYRNNFCSNSFCNYEGICYVENNANVCNCVEGIYEGLKCDQIINHCIEQPCKNGGECINIVGSYYCKCVEEFYGQNCTLKDKNVIKWIHIHYNHLVEVNTEQTLLIMAKSIGNLECTFEINSKFYAIETFRFPSGKTKIFTYTKDLIEISINNNIKQLDSIPYRAGYYVLVRVTFFRIGTTPLILTVYDQNTSDIYYKTEYHAIVFEKNNSCLPKIYDMPCESPLRPMKIQIDKWNFVDTVVEKSCHQNSNLQFNWKIRDYFDKKTLYQFQNNKRQLKIFPHTLWFNDLNDPFHLLYVIKLQVDEISNESHHQGRAFARCYVQVVMAKVIARIDGGYFRKINLQKSILLSAENSQDLSLPLDKPGQLIFQWSCYSVETLNNFCNKFISENIRVQIPKNILNINSKYNFTLSVTSLTTLIKATTWQEVIPVDDDPLQIYIECVKNCEDFIVNIDATIYLRVICMDCVHGHILYNWTTSEPNLSSNIFDKTSQLVIKKDTLKFDSKVDIIVELTQDNRKGMNSVQLITNSFPQNGTCSITPQIGIEFQTIFTIECTNFIDIHEPLTYKYYLGNILLVSSTDNKFETKLSQTEQDKAKIQVNICDSRSLCNINYLEVQVQKIIISEFEYFLNSSLLKFSQSGDMISTVTMINIATRELKNLNIKKQSNTVYNILEHLNNFEINALQSVEVISALANKCINLTDMNHHIASNVAKLFQKISDIFYTTLSTNEIEEFTLKNYEDVTVNLIILAERMCNELEQFPAVHNTNNFEDPIPFIENYPDYGDLDFHLIERINDWQLASKTMEKLFLHLGRLGSILLELLDSPVNIKVGKILWQIKILDMENQIGIQFEYANTQIELTENFLKNLYLKSKSKTVAQIIFFESNPFWWYPENSKTNTEVVTLNIFQNEMELRTPSRLDFNFQVNIFLPINRNDNQEIRLIKSNVHSNLDMPIYECVHPQNTLLIFNFTYIDADLKVLIKSGKRPKYREIQKTYNHIIKTNHNNRIIQYSNFGEDLFTFMAVIPYDKFPYENLINFTFQVHTYSCQIWDNTILRWTTDYCKVGNRTNSTHMHCQCNHRSTFSSKIFLTPNKLILPRDILLVLEGNYAVYCYVLTVSVSLLIMLVWAWYEDNKDITRREIIFVPIPLKANYLYLITISTGNHKHATTTANVSIILHGFNGNAGPFHLKAFNQKLFKRKSEHTFGIFSNVLLGKIHSITLSHDCSGRYPSWLCGDVRVKDVHCKEEYIFLVRNWLSYIYADNVEMKFYAATYKDLYNYKFIIMEHFLRGFYDNYIVHSIFNSHPRSTLTRIEKIIILFISICFSAVVNIMFFGRSTIENIEDERETYAKYFLTFRIIMHSMLCSFIGYIISTFMIFLFMKTKRISNEIYKQILD